MRTNLILRLSPSTEHRNRIGLIKGPSTGISSPAKAGRDPIVTTAAALREEIAEDDDEDASAKETTGDEESAVRPSMTSDYDSSNESPNDYDLVSDGSRDSSCESRDFSKKCMLCGHTPSESSSSADVKAVWPNVPPGPGLRENRDHHGRYIVNDGLAYDLEELTVDPLLNLISEWDYPIFELREAAGDAILSEISYRIFYEAGLLEAFKIPLQEFLNYFRALECGYKEKPCKNNECLLLFVLV